MVVTWAAPLLQQTTRLLPLGMGLAVALTNQYVLPFDYFGIHAAVVGTAAILLTHGLYGLSVPKRLVAWRAPLRLGIIAVATHSLFWLPPLVIRGDLHRISGQIVWPVLTRLAPHRARLPAPVLEWAKSRWFQDLKNASS